MGRRGEYCVSKRRKVFQFLLLTKLVHSNLYNGLLLLNSALTGTFITKIVKTIFQILTLCREVLYMCC